MSHRTRRARLLLSAALATASAARGGLARAQSADDAAPTAGSAAPGAASPFLLGLRPLYAQAGTLPPGANAPGAPTTQDSTRRPLMALLSRTPAGDFLDRTGINVYGWIEGSYTYNFDNPPASGHLGRLNLGRQFDLEDNDFLVNQLDLTLERKVDPAGGRFDVGGRIDLLYGTDARFVHSNGMFDDVDYPDGPQYQFDIPQLYVDLAIPVGNGLRLRAGKFEFFKPLDPNASAFYSHTFVYQTGGQPSNQSRFQSSLFGAALPFTLTGVSGQYQFNEQLGLELGISRGFDQSLSDINGAVDVFGKVGYSFSEQTQAYFALISGPEIAHDNSHYRTVGDLSVVHHVTNDLALLFDGVYGIQARPATIAFANGGSLSGDAHWYGVSGNVIYQINRHLSVGGRLEWYRDEQGFTTAVPQTLYEATLGVTLTPFPDDPAGSGLKIRPEIRYDYSDRRFFEQFTRHHQWTAAVDAIYNF